MKIAASVTLTILFTSLLTACGEGATVKVVTEDQQINVTPLPAAAVPDTTNSSVGDSTSGGGTGSVDAGAGTGDVTGGVDTGTGSMGGDEGLPTPNSCMTNCGFELGPDPSLNFLQSNRGPEPTTKATVPSSVNGFGGGTIYFPTNLSQEMAAVAISPGFTASQSAIAWWGPVIASHGFVVITIDTNSRFDQPDSRGRQLDAALSYLISESERVDGLIAGLVDKSRLATMGHSMGGGGSLHSASRNRLSAAIPLAPWNSGSNPFGDIVVPTMVVACQSDSTAKVNDHAIPFYEAIASTTDKVYIELANGSHNCVTGWEGSFGPTLSTYGVSWLKRFLDKDRRYDQFLCGPDHLANTDISGYRDTCTI